MTRTLFNLITLCTRPHKAILSADRLIYLLPGLAILLFNSCSRPSKDVKQISDLDISFKCPCTLQRDTLSENKIEQEINSRAVIFKCTDNRTKDNYILQLLLDKDKTYSNEEIIDAIDSTLTASNIKHVKREVLSRNGLLISYPNATELEIFGTDKNYYLIIQGTDSLDLKMENCIRSMKIQ